MIWQFNPKRSELFVPETITVIPKVKSLEDARSIMNTFNPVDWQYTVNSKTSKVYNFSTLEDAVNLAKKKSVRGTIYTVFSKGKPVASYIGDKELTKWKTIWEEKSKNRPTKNQFYYGTPQGQFSTCKCLFSRTIDVAEGKVRCTLVYITYVKAENGHLSTVFTKSSKVFHKDGAVYIYEEGKIRHISADLMSIYLNDEGNSILRKELIKLRPELRQILESVSIYDLICVFSRPTAYYAFDTFHKKCHNRKNGKIYYGYYPKEIVDESQIINTLYKRMRIPCTKTLRKLYNENPHNMEVVHWLKNVGFKDVNSYQKLVGVGIHFCLYNPAKFKDFFKKLIELRTENNAVRMIEDADFNLIKDVAQSYGTIDEDAAEFVLKKARNLEEIHETFNRSCPTKATMTESMIQYTDKEQKRYNLSFDDDIRFELAYSNKDLAIVGAEMGICVGGYAQAALAKRTTIVKLMKGNKHVACIEVNHNCMVQLKAKFNNPVESQYKKYIDEWLEHAKLKIKCCDYEDIGKPWDSTHNYAVIRPTDYLPVEHHPVLQIVKMKHTHFEHNNKWFSKDQVWGKRMDRIMDNHGEAEELCHHNQDCAETGFEPIETDELPF